MLWKKNSLLVASALLGIACSRSEASSQGARSEPATSSAPAPSERLTPASSEAPAGSSSADEQPSRTPDVIYVPTPQPVVDKMLELAQVKKSDIVYDLGCGDGRIVVTAAKRYGAHAYGFDIDP